MSHTHPYRHGSQPLLRTTQKVYTKSMTLHIKRAYDPPAQGDGYRVLVDRLWPRGISKDALALDEWCRDIAPSDQLRRWFGHDPARFADFAQKYRAELAANPATATVQSIVQHHATVTLLYGAKDTEHNQAVVLRDYLAH